MNLLEEIVKPLRIGSVYSAIYNPEVYKSKNVLNENSGLIDKLYRPVERFYKDDFLEACNIASALMTETATVLAPLYYSELLVHLPSLGNTITFALSALITREVFYHTAHLIKKAEKGLDIFLDFIMKKITPENSTPYKHQLEPT